MCSADAKGLGGTLTGPEIIKQVRLGVIQIDPFDPSHISPSSVNLTLGREVAVFDAFTRCRHHFNGLPIDATDSWDITPKHDVRVGLDTRNPGKIADLVRFAIPDSGWWVMPGVCYLMHVAERIHTERFNPVLDGRSTFGRLFLKVHFTAGWGEPGFDGQFTLEVMSQFPVKLYAGQRICQLRFHTLEGEVLSYGAVGRDLLGAVGPKLVGI